MTQKVYDLNVVKQKIEHYCAYQERCQQEVFKKLKQLGVSKSTADILMVELIQKNFLNEQRFAESYASGKFRMKKWGKFKIKQALKSKAISDYLITQALDLIDEDDYQNCLRELIVKKTDILSKKGISQIELKKNLHAYLFNKGYESDNITKLVRETASSSES